MQIGVVKLPEVDNFPVGRSTPLRISDVMRAVDFRYQFDFQPQYILGSNLVFLPNNLMKVFYHTPASDVAFEAAISRDGNKFVILYVKIVGDYDCDIVVPFRTIEYFSGSRGKIGNTDDLIIQNYWNRNPILQQTPLPLFVKPIFTQTHIDHRVGEIVDILEGCVFPKSLFEIYRAIYLNEPLLFHGLQTGVLNKSPLTTHMTYVPFFDTTVNSWSQHYLSNYRKAVNYKSSYIDDPRFDDIMFELLSIRLTDISITSRIYDLITGNLGAPLKGRLIDRYTTVLGFSQKLNDVIITKLSNLAIDAIYRYCEIYHLDPKGFHREQDFSSITIIKTISDEISISIHDLRNDRYVTFYTYFPVTALTTLGVYRHR